MVTSNLKCPNRTISIPAPRLPPELVLFLYLIHHFQMPITNHHLHPALLSLCPRDIHSNLKSFLQELIHVGLLCVTLTHPILRHPPLTLNDTHLNSYSVSSDQLEIGPELTLD